MGQYTTVQWLTDITSSQYNKQKILM